MKISVNTIIIYLAVSLGVSLLFVNAVMTFTSMVVLLVSLKLVWRAYEPPVLPFIIGYHWFQISTKIFHANILGTPVQNLGISGSTETAIYLSLVGLVVISLGFYLTTRNLRTVDPDFIRNFARRYSTLSLLNIYIITFVAFFFLRQVLFVVPQLQQLIFGVLSFKRVLIYFMFVVCFVQQKYRLMALILFTEVALGMTGFFSEFKEPFFIIFLAYFTLNNKISLPALRYFLPIATLFILMVLTWTAIKGEYRKEITGNNSMIVSVSMAEQVDILTKNVSKVDADLLSTAVELVANRISYIDFFGRVIDYVPTQVAHENGKLWGGAITHVFKPRIFFPNKATLDDSQRTTQYTGFFTAGLERGTSIGIGYFAESYIDFGPNFMYIPLFLLGVFYGIICRFLIKTVKNPILSFSMISAVLMGAYLFEVRNDKLFGGIILALVVLKVLQVAILNRLFIPNKPMHKPIENSLN